MTMKHLDYDLSPEDQAKTLKLLHKDVLVPDSIASKLDTLEIEVFKLFQKFKKPRRNWKTKNNTNNTLWNCCISNSARLWTVSRIRIFCKFSNKSRNVF